MKKVVFLFVALLLNTATVFAGNSDVEDFLDRYEKMVKALEAVETDRIDGEKVDSIKSVYKKLTKEVKKHKPDMSNSELEEYYRKKARYQKKLAIIKTKRGTSAVKGWFEGMM